MKKDYFQIKQDLDNINLADANAENNLKQYFNTIGQVGIQIVTVPAYSLITRLVGEPAERNRNFLKYKPAKLVNNPMRASFANQSVFYGCVVEDNNPKNPDRLALAVSECSKLYRNYNNNPNISGIDRFVGSEWVSTKDLDLVSLVHPNFFRDVKNNKLLDDILAQYKEILRIYGDTYDSFIEYFAEKYATRIEEGEEWKYNLTAAFAQSMMLKCDGIIYPSVQFGGQIGLNIAVRPQTVDQYFDLRGTFTVKVFKHGENMFVGDDSTTDEIICEKLGIASIDVLYNNM